MANLIKGASLIFGAGFRVPEAAQAQGEETEVEEEEEEEGAANTAGTAEQPVEDDTVEDLVVAVDDTSESQGGLPTPRDIVEEAVASPSVADATELPKSYSIRTAAEDYTFELPSMTKRTPVASTTPASGARLEVRRELASAGGRRPRSSAQATRPVRPVSRVQATRNSGLTTLGGAAAATPLVPPTAADDEAGEVGEELVENGDAAAPGATPGSARREPEADPGTGSSAAAAAVVASESLPAFPAPSSSTTAVAAAAAAVVLEDSTGGAPPMPFDKGHLGAAQAHAPGHKATSAMPRPSGSGAGHVAQHVVWQEYRDEQGKAYWFNAETGESRWSADDIPLEQVCGLCGCVSLHKPCAQPL